MSGSKNKWSWKVPRPADFVIGVKDRPYMFRWWIIPRNRFFNIYLHYFMRSDDDRALHDHPWWNLSVLLKGRYLEHMPNQVKVRTRGQLVFRKATATHRIELIDGPVWTLFITGPKIRDWGFHCPQGWKPWQKFVNMTDTGEVGPGCEG